MSAASHAHAPHHAPIRLPEGHLFRLLPVGGTLTGLAALVLSLGLGLKHIEQFYFSYLTAFAFWLSITLGALFFVLIQFVTKAGWSVVVRRVPEQLARNIWLFVPLFLPVVAGIPYLYHWAHHEALEHDAILAGKHAYLNLPFFFIRAAVFFGVWILIARTFVNGSLKQDHTGDHGITRRLQGYAAPALVFYGISQSFASFDWIMSLDPHWFSTIFGVYFFASSVVGFYAWFAIVFIALRGKDALGSVATVEHQHDIGKLLFAFVAFWSYIAFSQFFLIWYSNIPEETVWFKHRLVGSWGPFSLALALGHFAIPFWYLLSRHVKRAWPTLLLGALWMFGMHYINMYWLIMPNLHHHGVHFDILDVTTFIAVSGIVLGAFGRGLAADPIVPVKDPRLAESLAFENF